jgi:adenosylmethionine-8-amino-7-oxononanoate aminotransferase
MQTRVKDMSNEVVVDADDLKRRDVRHILHPHAQVGMAREPIIVSRGKDARVWDIDGKEYIDGTGGLWLCAVGHGRAELAEAARQQLELLECYASFWHFSNAPSIELATRLAELAPSGIDHVFFTNGGSEGTETAIKLARLAWHAQGEPDRTVILSRQGAYHGASWVATAATGLTLLQEGYSPLPGDFVHLAAAGRGATTDDLIAELEATIATVGAQRIAAFIGEPVMGVGGVLVPNADYWPRVEAVLKKHGILLILDEVITGFGRTGRWFAAEHWGGLDPDMIVTAKGITSGYFPLGAVLIGDRVYSMLEGQPFRHGFTYNGHPTGCAVALANLSIIEREGLVDRAAILGERLLAGLRELEDGLPIVTEARAFGLLGGLDIAAKDELALADRIRDAGLIVRLVYGTMVMSPPLTITDGELDRLLEILSEELAAAPVAEAPA